MLRRLMMDGGGECRMASYKPRKTKLNKRKSKMIIAMPGND
jgi:hypothetical protein